MATEPGSSARVRSAPRRVAVAVAGALVVAAGLAVHAFAPDGFASDAAGDALYAALIYLLGVFILPRAASWIVAAAAFGWCAAVELFQLTGLPEVWGAAFTPLMLVFGTVFAPQDLLLYAAGVAGAWAIEALVRR
ncbi:DUF2809 domain-containing protein [Microbacterium paludicola]|uniref:DUF2809 domain-containing protein n=1 Tax=Microbacterium paludicola TaxID=300019 RepID=A0A4Y9G1V0_9MICO|nr:DUF2809 domain-containing protein [Microbacterium paludicola]MBF0814999.1 DUF2809 domain-containing protein [Microbacterium paludicola]TFU34720.1 DUF2809 domain-containing protein [Microbacterium paludicola]